MTVKERLEQELANRGLAVVESKPLWPEGFRELSPEGACKFIFGNIYTFDESDGTDQPIEDSEYLRRYICDWFECFTAGMPMHVIKSRRMLFSWLSAALELYVAGCQRTKIGVAAAAFQGAGGSQGFVWRTAYLYDQLRRRKPEWKLPESDTPMPPPGKAAMELFTLPNGSSCVPLNADPDKVQGAGCAITRVEELPTYRWPGATWSQFRTINEGRPGEPGGFTYSIGNVSESDEYADLIMPENAPDWWSDRLIQYGEYNKWEGAQTVISVHYACDPLKANDEWIEIGRRGKTPEFWDQQYEGIRNSVLGERVISNYDPEIHCHELHWPPLSEKGIFVTGWDIGTTMNPAFALGYIVPGSNQVQLLAEYVPNVGMAMEEFAPSVSQMLDKAWPSWIGKWSLFENEADPAGKASSGSKDGSSAIQTARNKGWVLRPSTNDLEKRIGDAQFMFMDWCEEGKSPRVVVDKHRCPRIHAALFKNYVYDDNKLQGDGRILRKPKKDRASDIADAVMYLLMRARQIIDNPERGTTVLRRRGH